MFATIVKIIALLFTLNQLKAYLNKDVFKMTFFTRNTNEYRDYVTIYINEKDEEINGALKRDKDKDSINILYIIIPSAIINILIYILPLTVINSVIFTRVSICMCIISLLDYITVVKLLKKDVSNIYYILDRIITCLIYFIIPVYLILLVLNLF